MNDVEIITERCFKIYPFNKLLDESVFEVHSKNRNMTLMSGDAFCSEHKK